MDHLYSLTNLIINSIQSPGLPDSLLNKQLFDDPEKAAALNHSQIVSHFWVMIVTVAIGLCIAVIVPILGILFLCSCRRKKQQLTGDASHSSTSPDARFSCSTSFCQSESTRPIERRFKVEKGCDPCCRSLFSVIHFFLLLLISFFVICAFVTNEFVKDGLHKLPKVVNQGLDDVSIYLNNTQNEIDTLFITNFGQLESELGYSLDSAGVIIKNRFARLSQADSLEALTQIVSKIDPIHSSLKSLSHENTELTNSLHLLSTGLHRAKEDLTRVLSECKLDCASLQHKLRDQMDKFVTTIQHDHLPQVKQLADQFTFLLTSNIVEAVKLGKENFDSISSPIQMAINASLPRLKQQIAEIGQILAQQARQLNRSLRSPNDVVVKSKGYLSQVDKFISDYEMYRWYACLIASCIVTCIFLLYLFGYFNTVCANQPTVIENRNRGTEPASKFLLQLGIYGFFIFFSLILVMSIGLAVMGILSDRIVCFYLNHPSDKSTLRLSSLLQHKLDIHLPFHSQTNLAHVFTRCRENQSLYNSIELFLYDAKIPLSNGNNFSGNLSNYVTIKNRQIIRNNLNALVNDVNYSPQNIEILTPEALHLLERLKETLFDNFTYFDHLDNQVATHLDLAAICTHLNEAADALAPTKIELKANLRSIALILESYNSKVIPKIVHSMSKIKEIVGKIELESQYDKRGLKTALIESIMRAKSSQIFIQKKGASELKSVTKGFMSNISSLMDQYAGHIVKEIEVNVGRCEPVSRAVDASVLAMCKKMTLPFNGFWLSIVSIVILFIPITFSAYVLSNLHSKLRADPIKRRSVVDSHVPHDIIDEDDVPLSHVMNKHENCVQSYVLDPRHTPLSHYTGHSSHAASAPVINMREQWPSTSSPLRNEPPPYQFS